MLAIARIAQIDMNNVFCFKHTFTARIAQTDMDNFSFCLKHHIFQIVSRNFWMNPQLVTSVIGRGLVKSAEIVKLMEFYFLPAALTDDCERNCEIVSDWLLSLCRWLENGEGESWPRNALFFAEMPKRVCNRWFLGESDNAGHHGCMTTVAQKVEAAASFSILETMEREAKDSSTFLLYDLACKLRELVRLHEEYNCRLSLKQFLAESEETICYRILDRVQAVELLPKSIENYARKYMKEKRLLEDETLYRYVLDITEHASLSASGAGALGDSLWENRALAVIASIVSLDFRCRSVLAVAKHSRIPWSPAVVTLVENVLRLNHPVVFELENQYRLAKLRTIFSKYLIKGQELKNSFCSRGRFLKLLSILLNNTEDRDGGLKDAIEAAKLSHLISPVDVYLQYFMSLSRQQKISELFDVLEGIPRIEKLEIVHRLLLRIRILLDCDSESFESRRNWVETFASVCSVVLSEELNSFEMSDFRRILSACRGLGRLDRKFGFKEFIHKIPGTFKVHPDQMPSQHLLLRVLRLCCVLIKVTVSVWAKARSLN